MFQSLSAIWKIAEVRSKILYTLGLLTAFRFFAAIPVPGVDAQQLAKFFNSNQLFGLLNLFTGGSIERLSIVMLGVGPYITATIILQLLTMIFPRLKELYYEEGERGRQRFNQYGRLITVPLAALQSFGFLRLLASQHIFTNLTTLQIAIDVSVITAGTIILMWLGEIISEKGIGNGTSLIIFAGIVTNFPQSVFRTLTTWDATKLIPTLVFMAISLIVIAGVVLISEAQRQIPVAYAKRIRGAKVFGGVSTHLPIRVNSAGVIPIIFALSLLLFPGTIASFLSTVHAQRIASIAHSVQNFFNPSSWTYVILYFILVFVFTYFYTAVVFDPKEVSQNIQRAGGFIPGIRPGEATANYLSRVISRTTLVGAIFLGAIAVLPQVIRLELGIANLAIGGTGVLIVVSVVLETMKQLGAQLTMREYEGF